MSEFECSIQMSSCEKVLQNESEQKKRASPLELNTEPQHWTSYRWPPPHTHTDIDEGLTTEDVMFAEPKFEKFWGNVRRGNIWDCVIVCTTMCVCACVFIVECLVIRHKDESRIAEGRVFSSSPLIMYISHISALVSLSLPRHSTVATFQQVCLWLSLSLSTLLHRVSVRDSPWGWAHTHSCTSIFVWTLLDIMHSLAPTLTITPKCLTPPVTRSTF